MTANSKDATPQKIRYKFSIHVTYDTFICVMKYEP